MPAHSRPTRRGAATPRKGDLREQAILDIAERLLAEQGYDAMTIADIAAGAGLTRGALYFYFGSKQDVVTALVARTVEALREKSRAASSDAARGEYAIDEAMARTEALWRQHGVVMRTAIDLASSVPEIDTLWTDTADIFIDAIAEILQHMNTEPDVTSTDIAGMARALCWMIERSFYQGSRISEAELGRARAACTEVWRRTAR
ncbi:TetR/AcrR family transcriptional regulator [Mycolicibacterium helvum]|uniref:TetR family transcriptional regulator n=1 Tax=Mycolicibacterium helvum TaxID=1534349 RepID=A0A7I7T127_9MYCO|nr:TetR/AcrR family transcriptional regulator [Mycolicibacterium helvum]BBY61945.1 TetR family transcriptional regulator [Mycolicibacterium helvum]